MASLSDCRVIKRLGVLSLNGRPSHMDFAFSIPIVTWNVTLPSLLSLRRWLHHEEGEEVHLLRKKPTQNCISIIPHSKTKRCSQLQYIVFQIVSKTVESQPM